MHFTAHPKLILAFRVEGPHRRHTDTTSQPTLMRQSLGIGRMMAHREINVAAKEFVRHLLSTVTPLGVGLGDLVGGH